MSKDLSWLRQLPGNPLVVAEVKLRSPYGWQNPSKTLWWSAFKLCREVGDIISVHTNPLWGGSFEYLEWARNETDKPILAKGFHNTIHDVQHALDCGANHVLTVGWDGGPLSEHCWFEVESRDQLINASKSEWIVLNRRDPRTGEERTNSSLRAEGIVGGIDRLGHRICQASHIRGPEDVVAGVDAILIGQGLYD